MSTPDIIGENEFVHDWGATASDDSDLYTFDEVRRCPLERVWSVVECDNGDWIAMASFHVVNVIGYVLTAKPWTDVLQQAYWIKSDEMGDDDEREKLIEFLLEDWFNSILSKSGKQALEETLRQGCKGYDDMTIEQLRQEAEDAGYESEDLPAD